MRSRFFERNRTRLIGAFAGVLVIETLFLVWIERVRLVESTHDLVGVSYALHALLAFHAAAMVIFFVVYHPEKIKPWLARIPAAGVGLTLMVSATIALFDQVTSGYVTLFPVHLLAFGLLLYVRPPWGLLIFGAPTALYATGVAMFQADNEMLQTQLLHGFVVLAGVLYASHVFYSSKRNDIHRMRMLIKQNKQLDRLAAHDALTKLPNRRYFERQVVHEAAINRRYGHTATLLLIDIDDFKPINDTDGHDAGDKILQDLARIFRQHVRESDTVCRWGGDEFMFLLSHTDITGAKILADRLRNLVETTPFHVHQKTVRLTLSIGIATLKSDKTRFAESYKLADIALYQAKEKGKNNVVIASE